MTSPPPETGNHSVTESSKASGPLGFAIDRRNEIQKELEEIALEIPKYPRAPSKVAALNRKRFKLTLELEAVNEEIILLKSR